jgi:hypothetical protein
MGIWEVNSHSAGAVDKQKGEPCELLDGVIVVSLPFVRDFTPPAKVLGLLQQIHWAPLIGMLALDCLLIYRFDIGRKDSTYLVVLHALRGKFYISNTSLPRAFELLPLQADNHNLSK